MTETPRKIPDAGGAELLDWADPSDLPIEEVKDVFLTLSKALRAYQLYDPNNPVYKRFVSNLREALLRTWESRDQLQILIEEDRLTWLGEEVYRNESRSDSLAFILYRDGIRDITLRKGIEDAELEQLLDALHRAKNARQDGEDLATILWDLDLQLLGYSAVDLSADMTGFPTGEGEPGFLNVSLVLDAELGSSTAEHEEAQDGADQRDAAPPAQAVRKEDFNPTLYALDEEERRYLRVELHKERERDLRTDVLHALFDRLEEPDNPARQAEILGVLRTLLPGFLSRGALLPAAMIVRETDELRNRGSTLSGESAALAEQLLDDLSAPASVEELVRALEDGSVAPRAAELSELFRHLRPSALSSLLKGAEETPDDAVRGVLREAVQGIASGNRDVVIQLLTSPDPSVASGAVRIATRLRINEAAGPLARLLDEGPLELRRVIVEAAAEMPSAALSGALQRLLRDGDRELRVAAARVLGQTRYAPAASLFRDILDGKELRQADVTEKVAFFEAYGMLAGEQAVGFLEKILNGRGFLGRRESPEIRAGAALGLGKVGTPAARTALEAARAQEDPVVRSAVGRALRQEDGHAAG